MPFMLSTDDLLALENAIATAVSALDFDSPEAWGLAVLTAAQMMLGADHGYVGVPTSAGVQIRASDPSAANAMRDYLAYYQRLDVGFNIKRRELGLEVYHSDDFTPPAELKQTEFYTDWLKPYRLLDAMGMATHLSGHSFPVGVNVYHESERRRFGARGMRLLRLLLPAFKAGARSLVEAHERRNDLARAIDLLGGGVSIYDLSGRVVHQNPTMSSVIEGADAQGRGRLTAAVAKVVQALQAIAEVARRRDSKTSDSDTRFSPVELEGIVGSVQYRVRGILLGEGTLDAQPRILVRVETFGQPLPTREELTRRFRLTAREAEVALALSRGASNAEVAQQLAISPHTAERHTERVLLKLGVHSRAAVVAKVHDRAKS
jgi:DNA-binding CsgD family transcriptional regulator